VHQEKVDVAEVVDEESLVARRHEMAGLLVGAISDLGHGSLSLEPSADAIVDTLWLSPAGINSHEAIALMAVEPLPVCRSKRPSQHKFLQTSALDNFQLVRVRTCSCVDGKGRGMRTLLHNGNMLLCRNHLDFFSKENGWLSVWSGLS
jgi:hypothetical protein